MRQISRNNFPLEIKDYEVLKATKELEVKQVKFKLGEDCWAKNQGTG